MAFTHWATADNRVFHQGRETTKHPALPPGYYEFGLTMDGDFLAQRLEPRIEPMLSYTCGAMGQVLEEIANFWTKESAYSALGLSYKRGIMLHGAPGCGKTVIIRQAVEDIIGRGGIAVQVKRFGQFQECIKRFRRMDRLTRMVALVEDMEQHIDSGYEEEILELLDGSTDELGGRICFLCTTNKLDEIPERIARRPSRIDTLVEVGPPGLELREQFALYVGQSHLSTDQAKEIAAATDGMSFAEIKECVVSLLVYGKTAEYTVKRLKGEIR